VQNNIALNLFARELLLPGAVSREGAAVMSPESIALVALGTLGSVAIGLTMGLLAFPTEDFHGGVSFDNAFAAAEAAFIQHPEILNPAVTEANRDLLRIDALRRFDLEHVRKAASASPGF